MLSENQIEFTKENIDTYLKAVAKEYRKEIGKNMPAELILIGGAGTIETRRCAEGSERAGAVKGMQKQYAAR